MKKKETTSEPACPELEKMRAVKRESQPIGEFLEWLKRQDIVLMSYDMDPPASVRETTEQLLARYFQIDLIKVEQERAALLEYARKINQQGE